MSTIRPLPKTRLELRQDHRLPTAWVRTERVGAPAPLGRWLIHDDEPTRGSDVRDPQGPVLIMLGSSGSPAMTELLTHGRSGARVYVIAPSWWEPTASALRGCRRVLIRRVAEVPASAIHTVHGAEVWMGSTVRGSTPWRLRLDDEQAAALRRLFLRSFWHDAVDEAWTCAGPPRVRTPAERPFDVPPPPANATVRVVDANSTLGASTSEHRVYLGSGAPPSSRLRRLWIPPGGSHHPELARLVREGATVVWDDLSLPEVATDGRSGVVLLPGVGERLRIELSSPQASELAARLEEPGAWSFGVDLRLGDHATNDTSLWIDGAGAARAVDPEQVIDLEDVVVSELRDMDEASPGQWPTPHPLSLTVRYQWTVRPPRAPKGAKEDPLVEQWRQVDEQWASRVKIAGQVLTAADEHRRQLASVSSRLLGAIAGFERLHARLQREVESLTAQRPSEADPVEINGLLQRLAALEDEASRLRSDQGDAEHGARVEDEEERQRAAWTARADDARRELPTKRDELDDAMGRRAMLHRDLAEVGQLLAAPGMGKQARKDHKARRHKLDDELTRLDRRIKGLEDALAEHQRQIDEPFSFTPPARPKLAPKGSSGRFVPTPMAATTIAVPELALPEVGTLMSLKGQRYLVIDAWEHLEIGEQAARRLHGRLCAPEDA